MSNVCSLDKLKEGKIKNRYLVYIDTAAYNLFYWYNATNFLVYYLSVRKSLLIRAGNSKILKNYKVTPLDFPLVTLSKTITQ